MGRITSYDQDGHMVADFDKSDYDFLRRYGRTPEEVLAENEKLRELCVKALEWLRWAGGITCPPEVPDEFANELRKLGVEVDA